MKIIQFKWNSSNGLVGSGREGVETVEVPDDATEDQILDEVDLAARDQVFIFFEWGFDILDDK